MTATAASAAVKDRPFFRAGNMVLVFGASDFEENGGAAPVVTDFYLLDGASGTQGTDLIDADGVTINYNTGRYNPSFSGEGAAWEMQISGQTFGGNFISSGPHQVLEATDAYTAFGLDDDTDIDLLGGGGRASRFFVASNAAFDVYAEATDLIATDAFSALGYENIRYRLRYQTSGGGGVNRWGQAAQDPSIGGTGITFPQNGGGRWHLDDISTGPTKVFDGGRKTARVRGSIMEQAVSFQSRYNLVGAGINGNNYDLSLGTGEIGATVTYTVYTP
jgi:hypothetical protein